MKKALAIFSLMVLLFSALAGTFLMVNFAAADPMYVMPPPEIKVTSPVNNKTHNANIIPLTFTIPDLNSWGSFKVIKVQYSLDGRSQTVEDYILSDSFSVNLPILADGTHNLFVQAKVSFAPSSYRVEVLWDTLYSSQIYFTVDTKIPHLSILSTQGATYNGVDFSFNFTVSEAASWLGYSLDARKMVTVNDLVSSTELFGGYNCSLALSGLHPGEHSLIVYAEDFAGNQGKSETFNFLITYEKVSETEPTQETSSEINQTEDGSETEQASTFFLTNTTAFAIAIIASAALISFGTVAYFIRGKRKRNAA